MPRGGEMIAPPPGEVGGEMAVVGAEWKCGRVAVVVGGGRERGIERVDWDEERRRTSFSAAWCRR